MISECLCSVGNGSNMLLSVGGGVCSYVLFNIFPYHFSLYGQCVKHIVCFDM